jgi:hypothetical protein
MSEKESIIRQQVNIKANDKERPSVFRIRAGTLLLTPKRLLWVKGGVLDKHYRDLAEGEADLQQKGGFDIPIASIQGIESDYHRLFPFLGVAYQTDHGLAHCSFWHSEGDELSPWFDALNLALKQRVEAAQNQTASVTRELILVDQSHDQDDRGFEAIANIVNSTAKRLNLTEPIAFDGHPRNEILVANQHLLPHTRLLISLGTPSAKKFSQQERTLIQHYVANGGRLLITAVPPEDPPNEITELLDVTMIKNPITDEYHHAGRHKDHILVHDLSDHPINHGVKTLRFGKFGCYPLNLEKAPATVLATSSARADPPRAPIAALVTYGTGHSVIIGQTRLFQDDFIHEFDNAHWFENIITCLMAPVPPVPESPSVTPPPTFCPQCGEKTPAGAKYCSQCGHQVLT